MLRASAKRFGSKLNLRALTDPNESLGVQNANELMAATDAAVCRNVEEITAARDDLVAAVGEPGAVRAFATAGNFEMMNRLLDALGVGPSRQTRSLARKIGVVVPNHFAT